MNRRYLIVLKSGRDVTLEVDATANCVIKAYCEAVTQGKMNNGIHLLNDPDGDPLLVINIGEIALIKAL